MTDRKYSVNEIDRMRRAIHQRACQPGQSFSPQERNAMIEGMLRTYMQNGTDPQELEQEAAEEAAHWQQFHLAQQAQQIP